ATTPNAASSSNVESSQENTAAHDYVTASEHYRAAIRMLQSASALPGELLAQTQHELAALQYDYQQEWSAARKSAQGASRSYARTKDVYGKARVDAIDAAALMEEALAYGSAETGQEATRRTGVALQQARAMLTSLVSFHAGRGETFDQALAQDGIGLDF